jgi:ABC-type amino acid transport substrate-binding protein
MRHARLAALVLPLVGTLALAQDLPEIKKRGVLKAICTADEDAAMYAQAPGTDPGFEREILEGFARLQGLSLETVAVQNAAERIPLLNRGGGDVIIGIVETEARAKLVSFTPEILPVRHLVVNLKRAKPMATPEEFRAAKVGVLKGTTWAEAAVEAGVPAANRVEMASREELIAALRAGTIGAAPMTVSDFTLLARRNPDLQGGLFLGVAGRAGWAVRKEAAALKAALDEFIVNFRKGPSWSRLVVKYFGEESLAVLGRARSR